MKRCFGWIVVMLVLAALDAPDPARAAVPVGVATVDTTPSYPIRLQGYGSRTTESEGVASRLKAKAVAIGADAAPTAGGAPGEGPAVLIAVDIALLPAPVVEAVAERLKTKAGVSRERFVACATHTHCGPALSSGVNIAFGVPFPPDQQGRIDRYTKELVDFMEKAALEALANRRPCTLSWAQGRVDDVAGNRRVLVKGKWAGFGTNPNGPTDPSLPILKVADAAGKIKAVLMNFACHCTTLGGDFNRICAEWAGYACDAVEEAHPGATALMIIGCGADVGPRRGGTLDRAKSNGAAIAREANRLLAGPTIPLPETIQTKFRRLELPLSAVPTKEQLQERLKLPGAEGFFAKSALDQVNRGEALPTAVPYVIQTWSFGDSLAMVFLAGEAVVDYALRIKWETDETRLWVTAYSNAAPCYIPSRRVTSEGGYEVDLSMIYYGWAGRIAYEAEDIIIATVHDLLPPSFTRTTRP